MSGFTHESAYNESKEWYTPKYIFDALQIEFDLDPCSPGMDIVSWIPVKKCYTAKQDGLKQEWAGNVWMNPPYGQDTPIWMRRLAEHDRGIALVFSRTDTEWFYDAMEYATVVCFIRKRIKFIKSVEAGLFEDGIPKTAGSPGAGSMLIAFGADNGRSLIKSNLGRCLIPATLREIKRSK